MIILGLDPGLASTGYGVLDTTGPAALAWGTIKTPSAQPHAARLADIADCVRQLVADHQPACAVVERMIFKQAMHNAQQTSEARGVIIQALQAAAVPIFEYTANQAKQAVTGSGRAEKMEVQEAVQALLSMDILPSPNHAADALAQGLAYLADPGRP